MYFNKMIPVATENYSLVDVMSKLEVLYKNKEDILDILDKYDNLHVLYGKDTDEELYNSDVNEYDAYVYIGGSIFIENERALGSRKKFNSFISLNHDRTDGHRSYSKFQITNGFLNLGYTINDHFKWLGDASIAKSKFQNPGKVLWNSWREHIRTALCAPMHPCLKASDSVF